MNENLLQPGLLCEALDCEASPVLTWVSDQGLFAAQIFLQSENYRLVFSLMCATRPQTWTAIF